MGVLVVSVSQKRRESGKRGENVFEYGIKWGYIPRKTPVEQSMLHILFPLEMYWRKFNIPVRYEREITNKEGQIYPSFSDVVFPVSYKVELLESEDKNSKFLIHQAKGYVSCPVCGINIKAKLEDYEYEIRNKLKRFTSEVAYEIAIMALAKELAARIKSHVVSRHELPFKILGKRKVYITRYVGVNQEVIIPAYITMYKCLHDGSTDILGVYGILSHIVSSHDKTGKSNEIVEYLGRIASTTEKILGLGKEKIPILGAHRNTFRYVIDTKGTGDETFRVIGKTWFKPWLRMAVVQTKNVTELVIYMSIPRPMRMIYHYPIFRYTPHVIAYKINPRRYVGFLQRMQSKLRRKGYNTENLEKMIELVTGSLAYTKVSIRNAFSISLDTLEELRSAIEDVGRIVSVFLPRKMREYT